ncbi:MAG: NAD-dependent epimerase/dehydratase family protein [Cyclobacteriaceae bacterium]
MIGVTGANGLLGSFIIRKLIDENQNFVGLKRKSGDTKLLEDVKEKIEWRNFDLQDPVSMDDSLQGVTSVIHSAAMISFDPRRATTISRINTEGTRNVVNACLANNIRRFVYISSVAALGRMKGQTQIDETNKWVENSLNTPYATSKYLAELEVFRGQEEGLSTVILNPSVILAPADWTKSSAQLFKYVWDERRFYIDGSLNYVDVRDVAEAALTLLNSGMENGRFIVSAGALSYKDFFDAIAIRFAKKPPMIKLSNNFLNIVAGIEAFSSRIGRSEPLITRETARLAGTRFQYQNNKIKKSLHFEFQTLDNTLDWCCRYYMQKFGLKKG